MQGIEYLERNSYIRKMNSGRIIAPRLLFFFVFCYSVYPSHLIIKMQGLIQYKLQLKLYKQYIHLHNSYNLYYDAHTNHSKNNLFRNYKYNAVHMWIYIYCILCNLSYRKWRNARYHMHITKHYNNCKNTYYIFSHYLLYYSPFSIRIAP